MDQGEAAKELEELESRIERTRGLYEQYFMGIERLEPQTPRKDVDRRIREMRKSRLKNTAQRYKFNMLAQRYSTLSQYWGRIMRQIENGTYKRDVAKAAARFGADAALGALGGRKKNKALENVAAEAEKREAVKRKERKDTYELNEKDVDWDDDFDDEAPTPPPQRAPEQPAAVHADQAPPSWGQVDVPAADPPPAAAQAASAPIGAFGGLSGRQPAAAAPKKAKAGLRWGGGGSAAPRDPAAAKERLASLAAQVRAESPSQPELSAPPPAAKQAPPPPPSVRKPLISSPFGIDLGPDVPPATATEPGLGPAPKGRPLPPPAAPPPRASRPGRSSNAAAPPASQPQAARASQPQARPMNPFAKPAAKPKKSGGDGLDDKRLRQIYSDFVETKRKANESTAGITYEKLADSLRVQTDKLKAKHTGKKVDYQVVVKNGKTLIKPVIR